MSDALAGVDVATSNTPLPVATCTQGAPSASLDDGHTFASVRAHTVYSAPLRRTTSDRHPEPATPMSASDTTAVCAPSSAWRRTVTVASSDDVPWTVPP